MISRRRFVQAAGVAGLGLLAGCGRLPGSSPFRAAPSQGLDLGLGNFPITSFRCARLPDPYSSDLDVAGRPPGSVRRRVRGSSVANGWSATTASAPVKAFISVDLPALV